MQIGNAEVAEQADAHDSKSCGETRVGSTPTFGTKPLPGRPNSLLQYSRDFGLLATGKNKVLAEAGSKFFRPIALASVSRRKNVQNPR